MDKDSHELRKVLVAIHRAVWVAVGVLSLGVAGIILTLGRDSWHPAGVGFLLFGSAVFLLAILAVIANVLDAVAADGHESARTQRDERA